MRRLVDLSRRLRDPETGCPWDKKQTFKSLADCTRKEAEELREDLEKGDLDHAKEELGDVIFNCAMLVNLAEEQGLFTLEDVLEFSRKKMIFRHPHVFGEQKAKDAEEALAIFNAMKAKERTAPSSGQGG